MNTKQLNCSITKTRAALSGKIAIRDTWQQESFSVYISNGTMMRRYFNALRKRIKGLKETLLAKEALQ